MSGMRLRREIAAASQMIGEGVADFLAAASGEQADDGFAARPANSRYSSRAAGSMTTGAM